MKRQLLTIFLFIFFTQSGCFPEIDEGTLKFKEYKDSKYNYQANPELCDPCNKCRLELSLLQTIEYQNSFEECNNLYGWPRNYDNPIDKDNSNKDKKDSCQRFFTGNHIADYISWRYGSIDFYSLGCYMLYDHCCPEVGRL